AGDGKQRSMDKPSVHLWLHVHGIRRPPVRVMEPSPAHRGWLLRSFRRMRREAYTGGVRVTTMRVGLTIAVVLLVPLLAGCTGPSTTSSFPYPDLIEPMACARLRTGPGPLVVVHAATPALEYHAANVTIAAQASLDGRYPEHQYDQNA